MEEPVEVTLTRLRITSDNRQAALAQAIGSMAQNDPPAGSDAIVERAVKFEAFLNR